MIRRDARRKRPGRSRRGLLWAAVPVAVVLMMIPPTSPAFADSAQVISGASPYATCSTAGGDPFWRNAETSPSIAVNPATIGSSHENLIAVWEQDHWKQINAHGLAAAYSNDGGKTWAESKIPLGSCADPSTPYDRVAEPSVSIGPDGTAYVAGSGTKPDANAIWAVTSTDGGKTWGNVNMVTENSASSQLYAFQPRIVADPSKAGTAYLTWNRNLNTQNGPATIWFSKTADGGKTWSAPSVLVNEKNWYGAFGSAVQVDSHSATLFEAYFLQHPQLVNKKTCKTVKKHGKKKKTCTTKQVVPANPTKFDFSLALTRSADAGQTWSAPTTIRALVAPSAQGANIVDEEPLASTIDPNTGKLYVAFNDGTLSSGKHPEISSISSSDGGTTWSSPARVSGSPGDYALLPSLAVSTSGVVGATYYDFRGSSTDTSSTTLRAWFTSSSDGGAHFGNEQPLGGPYDLSGAPTVSGQSAAIPYIGEYMGLAAVGSRFQAAFVAVNAKSPTNPTDIMSQSITP